MEIKELAQNFKRILLRLEAEWTAERDSGPINIDHGKEILEKLCQDVLDFRTEVVLKMGDRQCRPIMALDEALKRLKAIRRHQMDGGSSFKTFWDEGNAIIQMLKDVPRDIKDMVG